MSGETYPDYLALRKSAAPPPDPHSSGVRVYADADGALRSIQSDGTDQAIVEGGASSPILLAQAYVRSPLSAATGTCVLTPGPLSHVFSEISQAYVWSLPPGFSSQIWVQAPEFSTGTLKVRYAELDLCSLDGANQLTAGLDVQADVPSQWTGGLTLDDDSAVASPVGTDLSLVDGAVVTDAGGMYAVSFYVTFDVSDDFAA